MVHYLFYLFFIFFITFYCYAVVPYLLRRLLRVFSPSYKCGTRRIYVEQFLFMYSFVSLNIISVNLCIKKQINNIIYYGLLLDVFFDVLI